VARSRAHGKRFSGRDKKQYLWTAVSLQGSNITVGGAPLEANIVEPTDWERQPNGRESATLVSIRGCFSVTAELNTSGQFKAYIAKYDEDETPSPNPLSVGTYVDEDILWSTCGQQQASIELWSGQVEQLHVKTKRRISNHDEIRLVLAASNGGVFEVSCLLRGLLMIH